jgi:hypothetical protein
VRKGLRPFSVLVAILAVCMFAAVGFRVGQSQRSSDSDAASTWETAAAAAYSPARASAYRTAWRHGYERGRADGAAAGSSAGARAGTAAGSAEAAAGSSAARAVAAVLAATPVKLQHGVRTERCIEVAGGLCETLGPRVTGRSCPSGSVADPEGGVVCVPQILLEAARMAGAPSAGIFTQ